MYRVSEGVRSTHGQDGAIVLDLQQGQLFNLNQVGSRILELIASGSDEHHIASVISQEFDTDQEVVSNDLREFIESLKKHRLLVES